MHTFLKFTYWWNEQKGFFALWAGLTWAWSMYRDTTEADIVFFAVFGFWAICSLIVMIWGTPQTVLSKRLTVLWETYPNGTLYQDGQRYTTLYDWNLANIGIPRTITKEWHTDDIATLRVKRVERNDDSYLLFFKEEVPEGARIRVVTDGVYAL